MKNHHNLLRQITTKFRKFSINSNSGKNTNPFKKGKENLKMKSLSFRTTNPVIFKNMIKKYTGLNRSYNFKLKIPSELAKYSD